MRATAKPWRVRERAVLTWIASAGTLPRFPAVTSVWSSSVRGLNSSRSPTEESVTHAAKSSSPAVPRCVGVSKGSDPAAPAEEVELDRDRDQDRAHTHGKRPVRHFEDGGQVREVHAVETGQEAQRKEQARDHRERFRGLVEAVRDRR